MNYFDEVLSIVSRARVLGSQRLDNGTELIGRVPHVAPFAWLHILFAPLPEVDVRDLEKRLGRSIPRAYREFMAISNGISLFSDSLSLYGVRTGFGRTISDAWQPFAIEIPNLFERPRDAKPDTLFIGGYKSDGSLLYIDNDAVVRCLKTSIRPLHAWESFETMLVAETKRLDLLFDENGRPLRPSEPTVP